MRKRELKNIEWGLLISAIILSVIGLVTITAGSTA